MIQNNSVSQVQSLSLAFQGLVIGFILIFPSLLSVDIGNLHFRFSFLIVAIIYFWPRAASYPASLFSIFLIGIFYDMASANTLGMWALAFLVLFMVLETMPHAKYGLGRTMLGFSLSLGLCFLIVLLIGWISLGKLPQIGTLVLNAIASILFFPIIYWVHSIFTTIRGPSSVVSFRE